MKTKSTKQQTLRTNVWLAALSAIVLGFVSMSCSDSNDDTPGISDKEKSAEVKMSYEASDKLMEVAEIYIAWMSPDGYKVDTLDSSGKWSRSEKFLSVPTNAGMRVICKPKDGVNISGVKMGFKVRCEATLIGKSFVLDTDEYSDEMTYTFKSGLDEQTSDESISQYFDWDGIFEITTQEVKKVSVESPAIDDDLRESGVKRGTDDDDNVKMNATAYYLSVPEKNIDEDCLLDNLVVRYSTLKSWDGLTTPSRGDLIVLRGSEVRSSNATVLKKAVDNGVLFAIYDATYDDLDYFADVTDTYCAADKSDEDIKNELFLIYDTPDGNLYFILSPYAMDDNFMDDYTQGQVIDMALNTVKEQFEDESRKQIARAAGTRAGGEVDLTSVVSAKKVIINGSYPVLRDDYRDTELSSLNDVQYAVYQVEYDIYHAHSENAGENRNYYFIHQEIMADFNDVYKGVYNKSVTGISKVCEWYGDYITVETVPDGTSGMEIHRNSPGTTEQTKSYTSGISWSLGGEFGVDKDGPSGAISAGISVENSETYEVADVTISNRCSPGKRLAWDFKLRRADSHFKPYYTAMTDVEEGSLSGRTTTTAGTDFVISFPDREKNPTLHGKISIGLHSTVSKVGFNCYERDQSATVSRYFRLPTLDN